MGNNQCAKLSGGVAVMCLVILTRALTSCLKVGAQTETELKEKKLRVEDALNATKVIFLIQLDGLFGLRMDYL